jgi:hypothetical protein
VRSGTRPAQAPPGSPPAPAVTGPSAPKRRSTGACRDPGTDQLHPGYEYFSSSADGARWPATPRGLWPGQGTLSLPEWWIDGDISSDAAPAQGYATCLRPFSVQHGWLGPAIKVSAAYGSARIWPGDMFGISSLPGGRVSLTWGSAVDGSRFSAIYASVVRPEPATGGTREEHAHRSVTGTHAELVALRIRLPLDVSAS